MQKRKEYVRFILLAGIALTAPAFAGELPTGPSVPHGRVDISTPSANAMTIRQGSHNAIVNWRGFSIGEGSRVDIRQPSRGSAILNRVTGETPSTIRGRLTANGQVFLVNANGIAIGPSGTVETGSFVASTLGTSDRDFLAGRREFTGNGASAAVVNEGRVSIGRGGYGALLGGRVENSGTVEVELGRIGMSSGEKVTLDVSGDRFLQVAVPTADDGDGRALIEMSGRVSADGGRVEMKAAVARRAARRAVNLSGVVEAGSVGGVSGNIVLGASGAGRVTVSGRLDARAAARVALASSAPPAPRPAKGGEITVTGAEVALSGATLDASGIDGGGSIRVGGDYQGEGALRRARTTSVDAGSAIHADALGAGEGGRVIVWSDERTDFAGRLTARGGGTGAGGFAEVSGKALLAFTGEADLSAPNGRFGTLLLDPFNVFIEDGPQTGIVEDDNQLQPTQDDSVIDAATLEGLLDAASVIVDTDTETGTQDGDITVGAPLSWDANTGLILLAEGDIVIAQPIDAPGGALGLSAEGQITTPTTWVDSSGTVRTGGNGAIDVGIFALGDGDWVQNAATLPAFSAADFRIEDSEGSEPSFLRALGGNGTTAAPYLITDVYGLQGIGSASEIGAGLPDLADSYALANAIDANVTAGWNLDDDGDAALGFVPIGSGDRLVATGLEFAGSFDGRGSTITGLTIDRPDENFVGLFGATAGGAISDVRLSDAAITGGTTTGALVGSAGVAGRTGTISRILIDPTSSVSGVDSLELGGMIGWNRAGIVTDAVSGASVAWDTAGDGEFPVPCGLCDVGGLIGWNFGSVTRASASGDVSVSGAITGQPVRVGGLVGQNAGGASLLQTYATGDVFVDTGVGQQVGGLVGSNLGSIDQSYAVGAVTTTGAGNTGVPGGLVGSGGGPVTASFWDVDTTGREVSAGGTPLTTAEFQNPSFVPLAEAGGWNFGTTWAPPAAGFYPELYAIAPVVRVTIDDATRVYGAADPPFTSTLAGGPGVFVFGPEGDSLGVGLTSGTVANSPIGEYAITPVAGTALSTLGIEYRVVSDDGTLDVTPAALTITANDATKVYGDIHVFDGTEFTLAGLVPGDSVASVTLSSDGAPAGANVGSYPIVASDPVGTGLTNYTISFDGTLVVTPGALTITANDAPKVYGDFHVFDGTEFTTDGLRNADSVDTVALASDGAPADANVGSYSIVASDPVGTGLTNYTISFVDGALYVTPAALTITANDASKTYGDVHVFAGTEFTTRGVRNADRVDTVALASDGAPAGARVGRYAIEASDPVGTGLTNYTISFVDGTLYVTPAALTITANDASKIYGDVLVFDGTEFTTRGLRNADRVDTVALSSDGAPAGERVGRYAIEPSDAEGNGLPNYKISYVDGRLDVTPAPLRITADDQVKQQGETFVFNGTEFTADGLVNGDTIDLVALQSRGARADANAADSPFAIRARDARPADVLANYDVSFVDGRMEVVAPVVRPPVGGAIMPPEAGTPASLDGSYALRNPPDTLVLAAAGEGGLGEGFAAAAGGPIVERGQDVETAEQMLEYLEALASTLEDGVAECQSAQPETIAFLACIDTALGDYAARLDDRIVDLPEPLRQISAVIRNASRSIAETRATASRRIAEAGSAAAVAAIEREAAGEARAAVQGAITEVHRQIALIRIDDSEIAQLQLQQGQAIAGALERVDAGLLRAVEL